ncbi:unnamed protein product [Staurois parvus]|uniref:Uncharacterized protein n=1 Tax=Staurois parvus TaxID=386267 RepID=A0ABN9HG04_9NEOB|nr:unnamed protein product [Staurois parvus]
MEASGGIGREGWRTLHGGQWRDWQRGVGGHCMEASGGIGAERGKVVRWMSLAAGFMMDWRGDSLCKGMPMRRELQ